MNIYDYMDQYGIYSFDEMPINEVDCAIFSFLSYVDFFHVVSNHKILLTDIGRIHFELRNKTEYKLLEYMKDTKRFRNCSLFRYVYKGTNDLQFSVISIEYQKNRVFVSFEGTDHLISGWKENLLLSYCFPTLSHKLAIQYLNHYYTLGFKKIIVGGHSKGGNLALVASMCCNPLVRRKIQAVYNFDGPGLLDTEFRSKKYKKILPKYHHIIPNDSMIGIMLYNSNDQVVHSLLSGVIAHDISFWEVEKDHFKNDKLSTFSKELHNGLLSYIDCHTQTELRTIVQNLDKVCQKANVTSLLEFKEDTHKIIDFIRACTSLDMESRNMLYDLVNVFIRAIGDSKHKDFMAFVKKFKLDI